MRECCLFFGMLCGDGHLSVMLSLGIRGGSSPLGALQDMVSIENVIPFGKGPNKKLWLT